MEIIWDMIWDPHMPTLKGVKVDPKAPGVKCSTTHLSNNSTMAPHKLLCTILLSTWCHREAHHNSTMEIMPEVSLVMGAPGAHPKDNGVNKGEQVITTDQKKTFFRSDHEAMKILREKKWVAGIPKEKNCTVGLYVCLSMRIFLSIKLIKKREKLNGLKYLLSSYNGVSDLKARLDYSYHHERSLWKFEFSCPFVANYFLLRKFKQLHMLASQSVKQFWLLSCLSRKTKIKNFPAMNNLNKLLNQRHFHENFYCSDFTRYLLDFQLLIQLVFCYFYLNVHDSS